MINENNTALRAVDACGGTYSRHEEASGYAAGHMAALQAACVAVGHADAIAAALYDALILALPYVESEQDNPAYKPGAVAAVVKKMRAAIERAAA